MPNRTTTWRFCWWGLGAGMVAGGAAALVMASGCSDDETLDVSYAECPNEIPAAASPCPEEGLQCTYVNAANQQTYCRSTCSGGHWQNGDGCEQPDGGTGGSAGSAGAGGAGGAGGGGTGGSVGGGGSGGSGGSGGLGGSGGQAGSGGVGGGG